MARGRKPNPVSPSNTLEEPTSPEVSFPIDVLSHPYCPKTLLDIVEATGALNACIDSVVTNTDLRGHSYAPTIDLSAADIDEQIAAAIEFRDGTSQDIADLKADIAKALGKVEKKASVEEEKKAIAAAIRREKFILQSFFNACNSKDTFTRIREKTRRDLEATGNGYWELITNNRGVYQQINWIPAHTMHLCRVDPAEVLISEQVMVSPVQFVARQSYAHFRRYVQGYGYRVPIYFKEVGDPRIMSSVTGKFYETVDDLKNKEPKARVATEVLHFSIHNSTSPYGIPRWVGELVNIYGIKSADVVNNDYFNKKTLPLFLVKISGGRVSEEDITAFVTQLEDTIKGRENYHKPLVLQAQANGVAMPGMAAPPSIDVEPLTKHMPTDGQFQTYIENCNDRIGASFRLPRLVRGDSRDMTRATATATVKFAEQQVFLPIRQAFDDVITKVIFPNLGVYYHRFESRGPELTDPVELVQMLTKSSQSGYLLPEEARNLAEPAYGTKFRDIKDGWATKPAPLVTAGLVAKTHDMNGEPVQVPPADAAGTTSGDAPKTSKPSRSADNTVSKSWITQEIEDRLEEGFDNLTTERVQELAAALSPYFKER